MKARGDSYSDIFDNEYYNNKFWDTTFNYSHSIPVTFFLSIASYIIYYALFSRNQNINWHKSRSELRKRLNEQQKEDLNINTVELNSFNPMRESIMSTNLGDVNEISITYDEDDDDDDERNIENNLYIMQSKPSSLSSKEKNRNRNKSNNNNIDDMDKRVSSQTNCRNCWCNLQSFFILLSYFSMAMCIHCICDFPLHNDDAHAQFVPFTDYVFHSPLSYWDYNHYGYIVSPIISLFVMISSIWIYKHKKDDWKNQMTFTIRGKQIHVLLIIMVIALSINCLYDAISFVGGIYHSIKLLL